MEVDYKYYTDTYGGSQIPADKWTYYSNQAKRRINYLTFNRAKHEYADFTDEINQTICKVGELMMNYEVRLGATRESDLNTLKRGVKSETVKSHSKSYETSGASVETELSTANNQQVAKAVREHLLTTGLLYRGL